MKYDPFKRRIIIKLVLTCFAIGAFFYFLLHQRLHLVTGVLLTISILMMLDLLKAIDSVHRSIRNFLESIRYSDFNRSFQIEGLGSDYDYLKQLFNQVIDDFQKMKNEKEKHYLYLQNVIEHIGIGLLAYRDDGKIQLVNKSACELLGLNEITSFRMLMKQFPELAHEIELLRNGDNILYKLSLNNELMQLSIFSTEFKMNNQIIKLISIQNIQNELEEQEMKAWQKLIRVLTHEIMNSITPISSLTSTVGLMIEEIDETMPECSEKENIEDIKMAISTIRKRSDGLLHFVETYRNLTKIPKPKFATFQIDELFTNVRLLMNEAIEKNNIDFKIKITPISLMLTADIKLIEQIIINLVKNAVYALASSDNPKIEMNATILPNGRKKITVCDNGSGILPEVLDKVFIPFFTTKPSGSGIGLSLSKEIMRMHRGTISVSSDKSGTTFTLIF
jgi:nitrogen fixation/metabolism regulation signal transduction histidine kinase